MPDAQIPGQRPCDALLIDRIDRPSLGPSPARPQRDAPKHSQVRPPRGRYKRLEVPVDAREGRTVLVPGRLLRHLAQHRHAIPDPRNRNAENPPQVLRALRLGHDRPPSIEYRLAAVNLGPPLPPLGSEDQPDALREPRPQLPNRQGLNQVVRVRIGIVNRGVQRQIERGDDIAVGVRPGVPELLELTDDLARLWIRRDPEGAYRRAVRELRIDGRIGFVVVAVDRTVERCAGHEIAGGAGGVLYVREPWRLHRNGEPCRRHRTNEVPAASTR